MLKTTASIITMTTLLMTAMSADTIKNIKVVLANTNQAVAIRPSHYTPPAPSTQSYDDTIIYARSSKPIYRAYEPITIQLKLKRDAYIYFWTVSHDGKGYLILPNNFEAFNTYKSNKLYVVPEKSADYSFISDRAGVEQIYVLATDKKIATKKIEEIFNEKVSDIIPSASSTNIKNFITKDILVIAKKQALKFDMVSFSVKINPRER